MDVARMGPGKRFFFDVSFVGMIVSLPLLTWYFAISFLHYDAALVWPDAAFWSHIGHVVRNAHQFDGNGPPVVRIEDAAATVRVNTNNIRACRVDQSLEFVNLETGDAELRVHACRLYMLMVPAAVARVHADKKRFACKQLRPRFERIEVIECDL